jgi:uncharacterized damage-inducible protein DinB
LTNAWLVVLDRHDLDEVIHFMSLTGVPGSFRLDEIVRQIPNHGTYHRGELRGLVVSHGLDEWPETDLLRFFAARR